MRHTADDFKTYLSDLSQRLYANDEHASVLLFGGGALALEYGARPMTRDLDAKYIKNPGAIRLYLSKTAALYQIEEDWINEDGQKFVTREILKDSRIFNDMPGLTIYTPSTEALLAMKVLAMRIDAQHPDQADIIFLLRELQLFDREAVLDLVKKYLPEFMQRIDELHESWLDVLIEQARRGS